MFDIIAFDADDTLWNNEIHYLNAREQFIQLCAVYDDPQLVGRELDRIEINNLSYYGYGIKSFALSMIETAVKISRGKLNAEKTSEIIAITKNMLDAEIELLDHVPETLEVLSQRLSLMLITKGDPSEQQRKINRSGLSKYFRYVEITGEKTIETYRTILEKYQIDLTRFLMIGNSLKSDILPVLNLGGKAIYIPHYHTWAHEMVTEEQGRNAGYIQADHIGQVNQIIDNLIGKS
ncbi:MAG: HAD family hydrolase [Anaerolineae bacterium]|nr:HAD family hydrolase [Anaerolineae bacterium]